MKILQTVKKAGLKVVTGVASSAVSVATFAQVPTGAPAEVETAFTNAGLYIAGLGALVLLVHVSISAIRRIRGVV